jgi:hypothetical protein
MATQMVTQPDLKSRLSKLLIADIGVQLCPLGRILTELDEETNKVLVTLLDSDISTRSIYIELKAAGYKIGRDSVILHRDKRCRCYDNKGA